MTRKIVSCTPDTSIEDAITLMQDNGIRHLPVVEDGKTLIAMISIRDLLDVQADAYRETG